MAVQSFPRFIKNTPHGVDKYEGQSANRIAYAIENHIIQIENNCTNIDTIPHIIGLEGSWGSGKSNVIKIFENNVKNKYYVFEYDAWGHQEDLRRRSFLETVTYKLIDKEVLPQKCSKKNENNKCETWNNKLKYLLARKRETISKTNPKLSTGIICAIVLYFLIPVFSTIATELPYRFRYKVLFAFIPILLAIFAVIFWIIKSFFKKEKMNYSDLLYVYGNKKIEDTVNEIISESEPSIKEFKEWMFELSEDLKRKLIIVFDNMDRLPPEKVKEFWSLIHTFFAAENCFKNIWVIVTFDRQYLSNAFKKNNEDITLTNHFINKTFPVIYRYPPGEQHLYIDGWFHYFSAQNMRSRDNENVRIISRPPGSDVCNNSALFIVGSKSGRILSDGTDKQEYICLLVKTVPSG